MSDAKNKNNLRTFYANGNNEVTVICSDCGHEKTAILSPSDIPKTKDKAKCKCKCKCGAVFPCRIEFRRAYRKMVRLAGTYRNLRNNQTMEILVEDVSRDGIGFTCMRPHALRVGDELEVNFQLDDPRHSQVTKTVTVRKINDLKVGAGFRPTVSIDADLGFYLLS